MLSQVQKDIAKDFKKKFYKTIDKDYYLQEARANGYTDTELFLLNNPSKLVEYEYFNSSLIKDFPLKNQKEKEEDIPF